MTKQKFLAERRASWRRLEALIKNRKRWAERGRADDHAEFSRLLREVSNDLATIRSRDWGQGLVEYLNNLMTRGHNLFYRAQPAAWERLFQFLAVGFPKLFRQNSGYFAVAAALFFVPLAVSWVAVRNDPLLALRVVPSDQLDMYDMMYSDDHSEESDESATADDTESARDTSLSDHDAEQSTADESSESESEGGGFGDERAAMAGFYVQHNVGIALQCFARGLLLGVGTIYTLIFNGIVIGTVAGYVLSMGHSERFLSFVVSHGSFELTAIAVAGGAGLMLGDACLHPGQRTRLEALRVRGLEAVQIAGGAAVMLVIAALIEAFWSPAPIPSIVKFSVGGTLWLLVALYLGFSGVRR